MESLAMLKFVKIIIKILKPLIKILLKLGILNQDTISELASDFDLKF